MSHLLHFISLKISCTDTVTDAMLYQLSYEASPGAGQVRVQFIPFPSVARRGHGFESSWSLRIFSGLYL